MSNVEANPAELTCHGGAAGTGQVEVLTPRDVPLGGPRAMNVRRTLPQRSRSLIAAWCFADHYGPLDTSAAGNGGMNLPPHPHTGLQTVTWLFSGEIEHRDSLGTRAIVHPGELNLMTAGHGICHSEVGTGRVDTLHGAQLWIALPDAHRDTARAFHHYAPPAIDLGTATARVFLGHLAGHTSPVPTFTPLLGAEIVLEPRGRLALAVDPTHEHGVLVDTGALTLAGTELARAELGYLAAGPTTLGLVNPGDQPARLLLLGGAPFDEDILMWWNFVGRSHDEIVAYRAAWENESDQFGRVDGFVGTPRRLPAPALPNARIKPRTHRRPHSGVPGGEQDRAEG
jgi:quercetin 2,3-dioxygenase